MTQKFSINKMESMAQDAKVAEESPKTKKVREKLKRHLDAIDEKVTKQSLERKLIEIHRWLEKRHTDRVVLSKKRVAIFDENQNSAHISQRVAKFAVKLQKENA